MWRGLKNWFKRKDEIVEHYDVIHPVEKTPLQEKVDEIVSFIDAQKDLNRITDNTDPLGRDPNYMEIGQGVWLKWGSMYNIGIVYDMKKGHIHNVFSLVEADRIYEAIGKLRKRVRGSEFQNNQINFSDVVIYKE